MLKKGVEISVNMNCVCRERVYGNAHGGGGSQPPMMIVFYQRYLLLDPMWNVRFLGSSPLHFSWFHDRFCCGENVSL